VERIGRELGTGHFANHVEKTAGKTEMANIFEYWYETKDDKGEEAVIRHQWITSIEINKRILEEMIEAGRGRWQIENQGLNNQKNEIYDIEHLNSQNSNAMKNYYLLTQISDIIMQLYLAWNWKRLARA